MKSWSSDHLVEIVPSFLLPCNIHFLFCFSYVIQKFDISELVAKRMDAQRRLQTDPNDIEALLMQQEIQMKMQNWCQSNVKPGQFTGELVKNLLPKEHLQGGFQAWAKKVLFYQVHVVVEDSKCAT